MDVTNHEKLTKDIYAMKRNYKFEWCSFFRRTRKHPAMANQIVADSQTSQKLLINDLLCLCHLYGTLSYKIR